MKGKEIRWQCSSECCWLRATLCHQESDHPRLCREISSPCLRRGSLTIHIHHTATHPCSSIVVNGLLNSPARPHYCHRRSPPFQTLRRLLFLLRRVHWWIEDDRVCRSASLLSCLPLEKQKRLLTALCSGYLLSSHHLEIFSKAQFRKLWNCFNFHMGEFFYSLGYLEKTWKLKQ